MRGPGKSFSDEPLALTFAESEIINGTCSVSSHAVACEDEIGTGACEVVIDCKARLHRESQALVKLHLRLGGTLSDDLVQNFEARIHEARRALESAQLREAQGDQSLAEEEIARHKEDRQKLAADQQELQRRIEELDGHSSGDKLTRSQRKAARRACRCD